MASNAGLTYPPRRQALYLLSILMLACFLSFTDRYILTLLMPAIQQDLHISDTKLSILQGLSFSFFFSVMALPFGWAADRFNRRNLAAGGIAAWCVATMACGLAHSYGQLLVARSMVGVGEATLMPCAFSMLADSFPFERRGRAYGMFTAASAVGTGVALVLGSALLDLMQGIEHVHWPYIGTLVPWQAVFFVVGAPGLIVAFLLMTAREPERYLEETTASGDLLSNSLFQYVVRNKMLFLCVIGAYSTYTAACYSTVSWAPMLMVRKFHLSISQGGFAVGAAALTTGVLGTILGGYLCDYWTSRQIKGGKFRLPYIWALIILPIAWGFTLSPTVAASVFCFALFIMLQNAVYASGGAVMQEIVPANLRGRATSLWYVVTGVFGQATGPTAAALLTDYVFHDQAALPKSMAIVVIPGVLLTLLLSAYGASGVDTVRRTLKNLSSSA